MTSDTALPVELLPCPFCGGRAISGMTLDNLGYAMCASDTCWGLAGYLPTEAEAIAAWNTRALSAIRTAVKGLEWQIDAITGMWWADSAFGRYEAWDILGVAYYRFAGGSSVRAGSNDVSAISAAQADCERRTLSALVDAPSAWAPAKTAPIWSGQGLPPYVLVSNGHHVGVGYRHEPNYIEDPEWLDEGGEFIEPPVQFWQPLPAPPITTEGE